MSLMAPRIFVIGSLNVDQTYHVTNLPQPGQTVLATSVSMSFGGKGANQAVAAARAGGDVSLVGCVGNDAAGTAYLAALRREGIHTDLIRVVEIPTGSAIIALNSVGENSILVHSGANAALALADIDLVADRIREADLVLMQCEIPLPVIRRAAAVARQSSVPIVLNPSPWLAELETEPVAVDMMIVNEVEMCALTGVDCDQWSESCLPALRGLGLQHLIVTRGKQGSLALDREGQSCSMNAFRVIPVDTVGAGDTFAGAFSVAFAEGQDLRESLRFANAAGALATLRVGAQAAIPTRVEIERLLNLPQ